MSSSSSGVECGDVNKTDSLVGKMDQVRLVALGPLER